MTHSRVLRTLCAGFFVLAATACYAADNPWNGTWKLNEAKSKMTGETETVSTAADGTMSVATAGMTINFGCDGKSYPSFGGRTLVCSKVSSTEIGLVISATDGTELARVKRTLSDGGKTQTVVETGTSADGTAFNDLETYKKTSGGKGWDGTWQNTKMQMSVPGTAVVQATDDSITFTYPTNKSSLTAKLDGTPATEQGPHPPVGLTVALTGDGPLTIHEVDTMNGTVVEHDTMTVSADGKTMTIEVMRTGATQKQVYVYDKQA